MLSIHIQSIYILTHGTLKSSVPIISGSEPKKKLLSMLSGPLASLGRIRHCAPASCPPSFRSNTEHEAVRRRLALFHGRVLLPPFPSPPTQHPRSPSRLRRTRVARPCAAAEIEGASATTPPAMEDGYANLPTSHLLGSVPVPTQSLLAYCRFSFRQG